MYLVDYDISQSMSVLSITKNIMYTAYSARYVSESKGVDNMLKDK